MTVRALVEQIGGTVLNQGGDLEREVTAGYCCDLLSWVMSHGASGMAWITVQTHMNVIAVATLLDLACVIVPESIQVEAEVLDKASEEEVTVIGSARTAYELSGLMCAAGVGSSDRL